MPEESGGSADRSTSSSITTPPSIDGSNRSGRGRSGRGGSGRNNRDRGGRGYNRGRTHTNKFEGREPALKGHIYNLSRTGASANAYTRTTEEIAEYIGRTYKEGNYVKRSIENMTQVTIPRPTEPAAVGNVIPMLDQAIFNAQVQSYVKKVELYTNSMQSAYSLIFGQCSESVRAKITAIPNHADIVLTGDPIRLLQNIKTVMFNFQTTRYLAHSIHEHKDKYYRFKQG